MVELTGVGVRFKGWLDEESSFGVDELTCRGGVRETDGTRVVVVADALRTWVEMVSSWMVISPGFAVPERVEGVIELI